MYGLKDVGQWQRSLLEYAHGTLNVRREQAFDGVCATLRLHIEHRAYLCTGAIPLRHITKKRPADGQVWQLESQSSIGLLLGR